MSADQRLHAVFSDPHLAWLVERLRRRLERGQPLSGRLSLRHPSARERRAVDRLLARSPSRGTNLSIHLEHLEDLLRHGGLCDSLVAAVEVLCGPQVDQRALGQERERRWQELWRDAAGVDRRPEVLAWLASRRTHLLLRRFSGRDPEAGGRLLHQVQTVIRHLPARGVPLAQLAADLAGDSHALDTGRPLATLVISAAAALGGEEEWDSAEARRRVWAKVGILSDDVSASVLILGLRSTGTTLTDQVLTLHAEAGEPCRLTIGQILRHPPVFEDPGSIYLCENPTIVAAAAERLGVGCAPLLCVEGQPTVAVHALLHRLSEAGARFLIHGDFDWGGLRIANRLMERYDASPWRFGARDFRAAGQGAGPLKGKAVNASWDPELAPAMTKAGYAVHEEQVLEMLLDDLGLAESRPPREWRATIASRRP